MAENRMNWHSSRNPVKFPLALAITLLLIFLASGTTDCRQEIPRPENWAPPVGLRSSQPA